MTAGRPPGLTVERRLAAEGAELIAGIDEVGRGSWAGPVSVGVALVDAEVLGEGAPRWLRDSKAYSEARREEMYDPTAGWCRQWAVASASNDECDSLGMTAALRLAARRALDAVSDKVGRRPDRILLDGNVDYLNEAGDQGTLDSECFEVSTLVGGDASSAAIAAASVMAKVTRDREMRALDRCFPPFDFASNKGYPSPAHKLALCGFGPTTIHRVSWSFMDDLPWLGGVTSRRTAPWAGRAPARRRCSS